MTHDLKPCSRASTHERLPLAAAVPHGQLDRRGAAAHTSHPELGAHGARRQPDRERTGSAGLPVDFDSGPAGVGACASTSSAGCTSCPSSNISPTRMATTARRPCERTTNGLLPRSGWLTICAAMVNLPRAVSTAILALDRRPHPFNERALRPFCHAAELTAICRRRKIPAANREHGLHWGHAERRHPGRPERGRQIHCRPLCRR
jgi:hypothetical protein